VKISKVATLGSKDRGHPWRLAPQARGDSWKAGYYDIARRQGLARTNQESMRGIHCHGQHP
jgi:hypothetical protein